MVLTGNDIQLYRLLTLKQMLKLEVLGMHRSKGRTAYSIIKSEFNLKGSKQSVLEQFSNLIEQSVK